MEAYVRSLGAYIPPRRMHNDELAAIVDTSDDWIFSHTGIRYRHLAAEEQSAGDLAIEASRRLIERDGIAPESIDLILLATSTPDYIGLPATACAVQDQIGAVNAGAMDIAAACTGFIYALETARVYVKAGAAKNVLVIGAEVYSKIVNWHDRATCVLFGDGAGAALVTASQHDGGSRLVDSILRSQGNGVGSLLRSHGGTRNAYVPGETPVEDLLLKMEGRKVYVFAVRAIIETINELLVRNGLSFDQVDWVVPHQANDRIIEAACKRADWPKSRFYMNIEEYANTSAASIPVALEEMDREGLLKRGQTILTVGFGSGLTSGGNLIVW